MARRFRPVFSGLESSSTSRETGRGGFGPTNVDAEAGRILDMYVEVAAGQALAQAALTAQYGARPQLPQALAAKIFCSQVALKVARNAVELFGARGLAQGTLIEKLFCDARTTSAEQGTNEVLGLTGARLLLCTAPNPMQTETLSV